MVWLIILVFMPVSVFGTSQSSMPEQVVNERLLTVHLEGVSSAKVSLIPFEGAKAVYSKPVGKTADTAGGETAVIKIPARYLPGEFVLRIDYRAKEAGRLYPAERIIYINNQNVELTVNPPYINNDKKTKFNKGERENTVYSAFVKENIKKRSPIDLLEEFLLSYDRPKSKLYKQAAKEFKRRRAEYNAWLGARAKAYKELYVSNLFQFQHIPAVKWGGDPGERPGRMLENYFEGIDFSDPIIIRSREWSRFMDGYIKLYGMLVATEEQRDLLFTRAGRIACEKASKGHPKVYGWMVDYFYTGYETYGIKGGITMLKEHIDNPNCLTSKREQITTRLEGMRKLVPGALSPDFVSIDNEGNNFEFHKWRGKAERKLLLFALTGCGPCKRLIKELRQWYDEPKNKEKLDVVIVDLKEVKAEEENRKNPAALPPEWQYTYVKGGVNSSAARAYAVLSTPAMFLIGSKSNAIVSLPGSFEQLIDDLQKGAPAPVYK